jgi:hypothetical protein
MYSGEGETLEGLVLLDTNLVIFGQFTISIFDLRGQLIENKRPQLDGHIFSIRLFHLSYRSPFCLCTSGFSFLTVKKVIIFSAPAKLSLAGNN